jgi:hypothetical protein
MNESIRQPIRVLVADDEPAVLDAYRSILGSGPATSGDTSNALQDLRAKLFGGSSAARPAQDEFELEPTPARQPD